MGEHGCHTHGMGMALMRHGREQCRLLGGGCRSGLVSFVYVVCQDRSTAFQCHCVTISDGHVSDSVCGVECVECHSVCACSIVHVVCVRMCASRFTCATVCVCMYACCHLSTCSCWSRTAVRPSAGSCRAVHECNTLLQQPNQWQVWQQDWV
jgi:hypothetical protein